MTWATEHDPVEVTGDLCAAYLPVVFGGWLDPWTYKLPGSWRGTTWPCPGRAVATNLPRVLVACTCRCHRGDFEHALPGHSGPRTGVHPPGVPR